MEAFRTLIKGWLGKFLLVLFLTPLALVGIEGYFSGPNEAVAVEVNGEPIAQKELENWYKSQREQYLQAVGNDETLLNNQVIEDQVYDAAVMRALLIQQATSLGIQLSDEQLGTLVRQQSVFLRDGKFSQDAFEQYMAGTKTNLNALLADFRQQTSLNLLTGSILNTALYGKNNTEKLIQLLAQERTTHVAEVPLNAFAQDFVPTAQQIQAYYDKHKNTFVKPESVDVSFVTLNKQMFMSQAQVTEQEIEKQYQSHLLSLTKDAAREVSHILIDSSNHSDAEASKIANEISSKIKAGEQFDALVQQYSEDPLSKESNGKVDGYTVGAFGDAFDKAVLSLSAGQVSAPIKSEFGYHIIRLDKIVAQQVPSLASMRDQLTAELKEKHAENAYQDAISNVTEVALETDSLDTIASQYKVNVQTAKNVVVNTTHPVLSDAAVKVKLFSEEVRLGDRNVSTGINLKSGETLWFKVQNYSAKGVQTLAEAKSVIETKLKAEEQVKQATAKVKPVLDALATKPATEALSNGTLTFKSLGPIPRQSGLLSKQVEQAIYTLPTPKAGHWSAKTVVLDGSLLVVAVSEIGQNPAFILTDDQKAQVVSRFDARGQQELNDYIEYLKANAKIEKNAKAKSEN